MRSRVRFPVLPWGFFLNGKRSAARADYTKFIIAPLNSNTGGNFYTSVLGGQRVSNEIVYDAQDNQYALVSKEKQPLLEVSSETNFAAAQPYIIRSEVEALTFAGTGASKAVLSDGELTLPADSFVMLTAAENAKRAVEVFSHGQYAQ